MKLPQRVKQIVASLAMEAVLEGVRGYLQEQLKPVTPEHLYKAIKEDKDPWEYAPRRVKLRGRRWARKLRKYKDRLTPELVLRWLLEDRPELGTLIWNMGAEGRRWLAKWTERIKQKLWPPEEKPKTRRIKFKRTEEKAEPPEIEKEEPSRIIYG